MYSVKGQRAKRDWNKLLLAHCVQKWIIFIQILHQEKTCPSQLVRNCFDYVQKTNELIWFFFITNTSCSDLCLKVWISLISFHIVLMSARQRQKQESGDFPCFLVWSEHVGASDSKLNINRNNTAGNSSSCACVSLIQSAGWKQERPGF